MISTTEKLSRAGRSGGGGRGTSPPDRRRSLRLVNRPYLTGKKEKCYGITIYEGGHLVHLEGRKFDSKVKYDEGQTRGKISDFSYKSRQRLMRKIAMIDAREAGLPVFLTLTYPEDFSKDWESWKRDIHTFSKAVRRRWSEVWGVWKMEFQKRGAPHFHLMLWGLPRIYGTEHMRDKKLCWRVLPGISRPSDLDVFNWINETWFRIVGSGDAKHLQAGINLEPVQSWKGVSSYVSKYLGKIQGGEFVPCEHTGRFWGVVQGSKWPVKKLVVKFGADVHFKYRRVLRKMQERVAKRAARQAKEKGYKQPAWTKKQAQRGKSWQGMHWYMESLTGVKLLGWAAE